MDDVEQYSQESSEGLQQATNDLIAALRTHTDALLRLRGGAAEDEELFARNAAVESVVEAWNEAVFEHTGTSPLVLEDIEEFDEAPDDEEPVGGALSVITRVDLTLGSPEALLAAGRAAYRRLWPDETDEDAEVAVDGPVSAVYTMAHEAGDPWPEMPGADVRRAVRAYVVPENPGEVAVVEDDLDMLREVVPPPGTLVFSEAWT
ncbi:hypothetical protein ACWCOV_23675 [Kribbella sp. NPDC002412]